MGAGNINPQGMLGSDDLKMDLDWKMNKRRMWMELVQKNGSRWPGLSLGVGRWERTGRRTLGLG